MLAVAPTTRIWIAIEPLDFRIGMDGIAYRVREFLRQEPMSGSLFVFRNRARTAIRILTYDGQGFWLCHKRLSSGRISWWPGGGQPAVAMAARELQVLLWNGKPDQAAMSSDWRRVT